jgi:DNA-binding response OmpR family regulator
VRVPQPNHPKQSDCQATQWPAHTKTSFHLKPIYQGITMDAPKRVLIVDDEPNVRLVFRTALEAAGYEVSEAASGEAALAHLEKLPADLVLLDLKMPVLDGMQTLGKLRDAGNRTPVVVITAHGSVSEAVAAMKFGAVDFLPKPVSPTTLRAVVAEVCARQATTPLPDQVPAADGPPAFLFREDLGRIRQAMERRDFDDAEFFLRIAEALKPGAREVSKLREAIQARKLQPEGFSFRALGNLLR